MLVCCFALRSGRQSEDVGSREGVCRSGLQVPRGSDSTCSVPWCDVATIHSLIVVLCVVLRFQGVMGLGLFRLGFQDSTFCVHGGCGSHVSS